MKTLLAIFSVALALSAVMAAPPGDLPIVRRTLGADDVPRTLGECFVVLAKNLTPGDLDRMRKGSEEDMALYHHGLGTWIRNAWGLWKGGALYQSFYAIGLRHPDDMSGVILTSFWRYLHDQPLRVQEQVRHAQAYWRVAQEPAFGSNSECRGVMENTGALHREFSDGSPRVIHMGECSADGRLWAYEVDRGWFEPDESVRAAWLDDDSCSGCTQVIGTLAAPSNKELQRTRPAQAIQPRR